jgi:transcriptional regulator
MYVPPHFEDVDQAEIAKMIAAFPLATIVCHHEDGFVVNHLPLLMVSKTQLIGHIAKANPLHQLFAEGTAAVAIFSAENSYISPNWYPSKAKTHRQVPTWNYQVVHLHGTISFDHSQKAKLSTVGRLTKTYEALYSAGTEWRMADAPADFMAEKLDQIVACQFAVTRTLGKSKLGQNKPAGDYQSVQHEMHRQNKPWLARAMARFIPG